jgi:hypothetical protein
MWEARCNAQRLAKYFNQLKLRADAGFKITDPQVNHVTVDTIKLARTVRQIRKLQRSTTDGRPGRVPAKKSGSGDEAV